MGKSSIHGPFSMAMLNNQRVHSMDEALWKLDLFIHLWTKLLSLRWRLRWSQLGGWKSSLAIPLFPTPEFSWSLRLPHLVVVASNVHSISGMLIGFDSACDTFSIDTLWSSRAAQSSERLVTQTGLSLGYDSPLWESTPFQTTRTQDGSFASLDAKPGCHLLICWEATMIATSGVASGCWGKLFVGHIDWCFTVLHLDQSPSVRRNHQSTVKLPPMLDADFTPTAVSLVVHLVVTFTVSLSPSFFVVNTSICRYTFSDSQGRVYN